MNLAIDLHDRLLGLIERYYDDPVGFTHDVIGVDNVAPEQVEMLEAARDNLMVSIRSGRGVGKTAFLVFLVLWFVCTRYKAQVVVTANTQSQLFNVFWSQLAKFFGKMSPVFKDAFQLRSRRLEHSSLQKEWFVVAITARKENPDAVQGFHAKHLLLLADEAAGIPEEILNALKGSLTEGDNRMIMTGNPTSTQGFFFESHNRAKAFWKNLHYSSEGATWVKNDFAESMAAQYGKESPFYYAYVLGEFPPSAINQLIGRDVVQAAIERGKQMTEDRVAHMPKLLGVDVARFGDDRSTMIKRQGLAAWDLKAWHQIDTVQLSGLVIQEIEAWGPDGVFVDVVGVGAGVFDNLVHAGYGDICHPVNGGLAAKKSNKYYNLRAEMWAEYLNWLKGGGCLPDDEDLIYESTGPTYTFDNKGRMQLEKKEDMKKRGLASPDKAESLVHTFAFPVRSKVLPLKNRGGARTDYNVLRKRKKR